MNSNELDEALAKLGMTQDGAAHYFDIGERTMRRYIAGEMPVPTAIALAITALLGGLEPTKLRERAGLESVDFAPRSAAGRPKAK